MNKHQQLLQSAIDLINTHNSLNALSSGQNSAAELYPVLHDLLNSLSLSTCGTTSFKKDYINLRDTDDMEGLSEYINLYLSTAPNLFSENYQITNHNLDLIRDSIFMARQKNIPLIKLSDTEEEFVYSKDLAINNLLQANLIKAVA